MQLGQVIGRDKGLVLTCGCGHKALLDSLDTLARFGADMDFTEFKRRCRCSKCQRHELRHHVIDLHNGKPLLMRDVRRNVWHRCPDPCFFVWWLSPIEARAFGDMPFERYASSRTCPRCNRQSKFSIARLTHDAIPGPVAPMMGRG